MTMFPSFIKVKNVNVRLISDVFEPIKLPPSKMFKDIIGNVDVSDHDTLVKIFRDKVESDNVEIVDWMHEVAAVNAYIDSLNEYLTTIPLSNITPMASNPGNVKSLFVSTSGDGYIPGVHLSNIGFESVMANNISKYVYVFYNDIKIPVPFPGKKTIVSPSEAVFVVADKLPNYIKQWFGFIMKYTNLLTTNLKKEIPFPRIKRFNAPLFFDINPDVSLPIQYVKVILSSFEPGKVEFILRGPKGKLNKVFDRFTVNVNGGDNEVVFNVTAIPYVPRFTLHLDPEDKIPKISVKNVVVSPLPM